MGDEGTTAGWSKEGDQVEFPTYSDLVGGDYAVNGEGRGGPLVLGFERMLVREPGCRRAFAASRGVSL